MSTNTNTSETVITCKHCGCVIEGEPAMHHGDTYCEDCVELLGYEKCDACGEWFDPDCDEMIEYDGLNLCEDCARDRGLEKCENCGEWHQNRDFVTVYGSGRISDLAVCQSCLEDMLEREEAFYCDDCCDYYQSRANDEYCTADGSTICESCRNDHYAYCEDCEELYHVDDCVWNDNDDCYYCENCADRHRSCIHDYGFKPRPVFHGIFGKYRPTYGDPLTIGFELEVDDGNDEDGCAQEIMDNFDEDTLYLKHDSSVTFEIVTHPHTLEAYRKEFDLETLCAIPPRYDFSSHNCGTCGLHMHVGRDQLGATSEDKETTIAKVALLMYRHWPSLVKFSRRRESDLSRWANRPDLSFNPRVKYTDDKLKELVRSYYSCRGRYQALNLENRGTIEFRLWRGTLKPGTVDATLQLTSNIVMYAMTHTFEDVAKSAWTDITQYELCENLDNYLEERSLTLGEEPFNIPYNNEVTPEPARTNPSPDGAKFHIGDRVRFNGNRDDFFISPAAEGLTGTVVYIDKGAGSAFGDVFRYAILLDEPFPGAHGCHGHVEGYRGYYGLDQHLELVQEAPHTGTFYVGDRVRLRVTTGLDGRTGTIRYVEGAAAAVEVDNFTTGHDCDGHVTLGAGWWVFPDEMTHLSDEDENDFRVGDRVICAFGSSDLLGTVINASHGLLGVRFDERSSSFHDLDGLCEDGYGWWAFPNMLRHVA